VVRWKKGQKRLDAAGQERNAWEIARGKGWWGERKPLWDSQARPSRQTGVLALPVRHAESPGERFLGVVRQGKGREPWYLLTQEPVQTVEQVWEIVFACATRWTSEEHVRCEKTERHRDPFRVQDEEAQHTRVKYFPPSTPRRCIHIVAQPQRRRKTGLKGYGR